MKVPSRPTVLAALFAAVLVAAAPLSAHAQAADAAPDQIDELVHQWEDGAITAEEALEQMEGLIHDIPASDRGPVLAAIDEVVHHWEDGETQAEAAMEEIEAIVHGAVTHAEAPAPAVTGNAGPLGGGTGLPMMAGLFAVTLALLAAARVAARPVR